MSLITLPASFKPRSCQFTQYTNERVSASPFGGSEQAVDLLNDRWMCSVELPMRKHADAAVIEAFIGAMRGKTNTVNLWHFTRPAPRGTIAGAKTLSAGAAQGAASVSITATGTLLAGDLIGISGLLLMVAADCTSSAGVITATLTNRLRTALSISAAVTTAKPSIPMRMMSTSGVQYQPGFANSVSFDFAEAI